MTGTEAPQEPSRQVVSDMMHGVGATIMGRNMFGPIRGETVFSPLLADNNLCVG
jgi:hypothetical protein